MSLNTVRCSLRTQMPQLKTTGQAHGVWGRWKYIRIHCKYPEILFWLMAVGKNPAERKGPVWVSPVRSGRKHNLKKHEGGSVRDKAGFWVLSYEKDVFSDFIHRMVRNPKAADSKGSSPRTMPKSGNQFAQCSLECCQSLIWKLKTQSLISAEKASGSGGTLNTQFS